MKHIFIFFWGYATKMSIDFLRINAANDDVEFIPYFFSLIIIMCAVIFGFIAAAGIIGETWDIFDKKGNK